MTSADSKPESNKEHSKIIKFHSFGAKLELNTLFPLFTVDVYVCVCFLGIVTVCQHRFLSLDELEEGITNIAAKNKTSPRISC